MSNDTIEIVARRNEFGKSSNLCFLNIKYSNNSNLITQSSAYKPVFAVAAKNDLYKIRQNDQTKLDKQRVVQNHSEEK
ncbi:hypothetical protein T01_9268 [Trichinella spiralis]|uniref:Uncharacterized protein n=1 Tax=Trichinella spiralis TaxID=6334 RepID=A0A0V1B1P6_TRISP|nr:hypothetical protein T01_9268 [Trichinella spiralis]